MSVRLARIPFLPVLLHRAGLLGASQYQFVQFARSNEIEHGDIVKGLPLPTASVDVLYSSHMLEHLDREEASLFLREARRVLRAGGIIRLAVPDLHKHLQRYIESADADSFIEDTHLCAPRPRTIAQRLRLLLVGARHHNWMYDGASLCRLLEKHGFVKVAVVEAGETRIQAPGPLDLHERAHESVYVEAESP